MKGFQMIAYRIEAKKEIILPNMKPIKIWRVAAPYINMNNVSRKLASGELLSVRQSFLPHFNAQAF